MRLQRHFGVKRAESMFNERKLRKTLAELLQTAGGGEANIGACGGHGRNDTSRSIELRPDVVDESPETLVAAVYRRL